MLNTCMRTGIIQSRQPALQNTNGVPEYESDTEGTGQHSGVKPDRRRGVFDGHNGANINRFRPGIGRCRGNDRWHAGNDVSTNNQLR